MIIRAVEPARKNQFKKFYSEKPHRAENESVTELFMFLRCQTHPACAQNRKIVGNQSGWSTQNPQTSSANQNRARKNPSTLSANQNRVIGQPGALG